MGGGSGDGGRWGWGRRKRKITFIRIRARYDTKGYVLHKIPLAPSLLDLLTNISGDILILSGELANSFIQTFISLVICYSQVAVSQIVLLSFSTTTPVPSPTYPCFLHFFSFFFFYPSCTFPFFPARSLLSIRHRSLFLFFLFLFSFPRILAPRSEVNLQNVRIFLKLLKKVGKLYESSMLFFTLNVIRSRTLRWKIDLRYLRCNR